MSANKKPVNTPLHLLQQLSGSLLEHLESACSQALADAEKLLAKLEKQRGKAQEKLHKSRTKVQDAAAAGKKKKQAKAHDSVSELEELLDDLKERQAETRAYIVELKRDAQESLKLAAGVGRVREAASKAIETRSTSQGDHGIGRPACQLGRQACGSYPSQNQSDSFDRACRSQAGSEQDHPSRCRRHCRQTGCFAQHHAQGPRRARRSGQARGEGTCQACRPACKEACRRQVAGGSRSYERDRVGYPSRGRSARQRWRVVQRGLSVAGCHAQCPQCIADACSRRR